MISDQGLSGIEVRCKHAIKERKETIILHPLDVLLMIEEIFEARKIVCRVDTPKSNAPCTD